MMPVRIPFTGPGMMAAIIAGTKTQTRRVVKLNNPGHILHEGWPTKATLKGLVRLPCPFGVKGDTVYGTEDFCRPPPPDSHDIEGAIHHTVYRADGDNIVLLDDNGYAINRKDGEPKNPWTSAMFMPVALSRCPLILTAEPRIERLNDISEADAIAEGIEAHDDDGVTYYGPFGKGHACPIAAYRKLWESIHGVRSWYLNPYVWVILFTKKA